MSFEAFHEHEQKPFLTRMKLQLKNSSRVYSKTHEPNLLKLVSPVGTKKTNNKQEWDVA